MAAPMRSVCSRWQSTLKCVLSKISSTNGCKTIPLVPNKVILSIPQRHFLSTGNNFKPKLRFVFGGLGGVLGVIVAAVGIKVVCEEKIKKPSFKPSRSVTVPTDTSGLKLTLYQFQSCPFCCKVRATLDYYGLSYDVIEVNSVLKTEIKWSKYKKVPIIVVDGESKEDFTQLNDSSVIMSVLESFHFDKSQSLEKLKDFYPEIETDDSRGKPKKDFGNKYFIMYQDMISDSRSPEERKEERRWRQWVDSDFVHVLSPNAYRTPREAIQAFYHFSDVGEWERNFSYPMRMFVIYTGASVMYLVSKLLKRRYNLNDDVRQSLYDSSNVWVRAVKKKGKYMGGDRPNLADLSVYGVLSSIEGCDCFIDLMGNSKIGPWYQRMQKAVNSHEGATYFHS